MMGKKLTKIEFSPPLEMEEGETIVVNTDPPIKIIGGGSQLDRIERMLKWIITTKKFKEFVSAFGRTLGPENKKLQKMHGERQKKLLEQIPDISDILEEKK